MKGALAKIPASVQLAMGLSAALTLTLTGAVEGALTPPGPATIALPDARVLDYASDGAGTFGPVGFDLVREIIGPDLLGDIGPGAPAPIGVAGPIAPIEGPSQPNPPGSDPGPQPSPDPRTSPPPDREIEPPLEFDDEPILSVSLSADRSKAAPGDDIRFTVTARNIGTATASSVRVESHAPEGTRYLGADSCGGETVDLLPGSGSLACVDGDDVIPPGGYEPDEHFGKTIGKLLPGQSGSFSFWLRIDSDAERGSSISNHGHASAVNADTRTSSARTVTIT